MRNIYRGLAVALVAGIALAGAAVSPAYADSGTTPVSCDTTPTWYYIKNHSTGLYLTVFGESDLNSARIIQDVKMTGDQGQAWLLWKDPSSGYCVLRSATTSSWKAISINGGSKALGAKAIQYTYEQGVTNEEWTARVQPGNNVWEFVNRNSGYDLEIPNNNKARNVQADQWKPVDGAGWELWELQTF